MRELLKPLAGLFMLACLPAAALADDSDHIVFGGDIYASGTTVTLKQDSPRSAFVSGFSANIDAPVERDAHIAGAHIDVSAPIGGNLYAAGFWLVIDDMIGGDVTAAGYSVSLDDGASVGGNARITARNITIDAPVSGSLLATAQTIDIDTEISGDVMLVAGKINFGANARIDGSLVYVSPTAIAIPESVIPADRVIHRQVVSDGFATLVRLGIAGAALHDMVENGDLGDTVRNAAISSAETAATKAVINGVTGSDKSGKSSFVAMAVSALVTIVILLAITAALVSLAPKRTEQVRTRLTERPWASLVYGLLALSLVIGTVPVAIMTLVGIVLVPFLLVAIVIIWVLAYLMAVYTLSWWAVTAIRPFSPTLVNRMLAMFIGLVIVAVAHLYLLLGWIVGLLLVLFGLGGMSATCARIWMDRKDTPKATTTEDTAE